MKTAILILVAVLAYGGTVVVLQGRLHNAEATVATLERDLAAAREDAARWEAAHAAARQGSSALLTQAQSCLDREAQARADADEWRALLEAATLRDMTQHEEQGVPDNATRDALGDMLDKPL